MYIVPRPAYPRTTLRPNLIEPLESTNSGSPTDYFLEYRSLLARCRRDGQESCILNATADLDGPTSCAMASQREGYRLLWSPC